MPTCKWLSFWALISYNEVMFGRAHNLGQNVILSYTDNALFMAHYFDFSSWNQITYFRNVKWFNAPEVDKRLWLAEYKFVRTANVNMDNEQGNINGPYANMSDDDTNKASLEAVKDVVCIMPSVWPMSFTLLRTQIRDGEMCVCVLKHTVGTIKGAQNVQVGVKVPEDTEAACREQRPLLEASTAYAYPNAKANSINGGSPLNTGLDIAPGQPLKISAVGEWFLAVNGNGRTDANGALSWHNNMTSNGLNAPYGGLVARFADGPFFFVGVSFYTCATTTHGRLYLYYWDSNSEDNSGSIRVKIEYSPDNSLPQTVDPLILPYLSPAYDHPTFAHADLWSTSTPGIMPGP